MFSFDATYTRHAHGTASLQLAVLLKCINIEYRYKDNKNVKQDGSRYAITCRLPSYFVV